MHTIELVKIREISYHFKPKYLIYLRLLSDIFFETRQLFTPFKLKMLSVNIGVQKSYLYYFECSLITSYVYRGERTRLPW